MAPMGLKWASDRLLAQVVLWELYLAILDWESVHPPPSSLSDSETEAEYADGEKPANCS